MIRSIAIWWGAKLVAVLGPSAVSLSTTLDPETRVAVAAWMDVWCSRISGVAVVYFMFRVSAMQDRSPR